MTRIDSARNFHNNNHGFWQINYYNISAKRRHN